MPTACAASCHVPPARSCNLQNACACELLALACRHGHPPGPRLPDPVEAALDALARALRATAGGGRDAQRVPGGGAQPRRRAHRGPGGPARRGRPGARAARPRHLHERGRAPVRREPLGRRAVAACAACPRRASARAANLARIADILERNLKPERIAAVVREPARPTARVDPRPGRARAATTRRARCWSRRSTGRARPDAPHRARGDLRARRRSRLGRSAGRVVLASGGGRWNPPGAFAALYLCRDVETARANARRLLDGQPFTFDDLLPERLPALVETDRAPRPATSTPSARAGWRRSACRRPIRATGAGSVIGHERCQADRR